VCGRFTLTTPADVVAEHFDVEVPGGLVARYNIAPTQPVACVRTTGRRELVLLRWGLIPAWAKDPAVGARMINARAETAADKPAFRAAFRHRRCLVVADGFYEWKRAGTRKQPYYVRRPDHGPLAFAGLWERWQSDQKGTIESCTIVTTAANAALSSIHERMPVILSPPEYDLWLDPDAGNLERLGELLIPCPDGTLAATAVSTHVNSPGNDDPRCIEALPNEELR
jgi:putative SOS response-associated peptidase YedK